jgi:hypothetical protein
MNTRRRSLALLLLGLVLAACSGGGTAPSVAPSASPSAGPVTTPEQAIARVVAADPRFAGIQPFDPNLIGQSSWYQVTPASGVGVFVVKVRLGWGDCPAGCISEHIWQFAIGPDGSVTTQSETGDAVPPEAWPSPGPAASGDAGATGLRITVAAGPTCPVEQVGKPCPPHPVAGAVIVIRDSNGNQKGEVRSGPDGMAVVDLPAGEYVLEPQPVQGMMGGASPMNVTVGDGGPTEVTIVYDTGIR